MIILILLKASINKLINNEWMSGSFLEGKFNNLLRYVNINVARQLKETVWKYLICLVFWCDIRRKMMKHTITMTAGN